MMRRSGGIDVVLSILRLFRGPRKCVTITNNSNLIINQYLTGFTSSDSSTRGEVVADEAGGVAT